jgi:hypothetical protein
MRHISARFAPFPPNCTVFKQFRIGRFRHSATHYNFCMFYPWKVQRIARHKNESHLQQVDGMDQSCIQVKLTAFRPVCCTFFQCSAGACAPILSVGVGTQGSTKTWKQDGGTQQTSRVPLSSRLPGGGRSSTPKISWTHCRQKLLAQTRIHSAARRPHDQYYHQHSNDHFAHQHDIIMTFG